MGRPKKEFEITTMKVPKLFRDAVVFEAKRAGVDPTDLLYGKCGERK